MQASPQPAPPGTIRGKRVNLRRLSSDDKERLRAILAEPEVGRWWAPLGADVAVDDLYEDDKIVYAIEIDGTVAGAIQYGEENEPGYRHASIDVFLGTAHQNRGLGSDAVRALARYLFEERGHHRITIDPAVTNERAIHVYERIGFRRVGIMRGYERGADGTWHDGLLLDLLRGEMIDSPE